MTRTTINASEATIRAVGAALGRAALFDDKITAEDTARIAAWSEAIDPYKLAVEDLLQAVTAHYQSEALRTVTSADLIRLGRDIRKDRAQRESIEDRKAHEDAMDAARGLTPPDPQMGGLPIAGGDGTPVPGAYAVNDAIDRVCPSCEAPAGEACFNVKSGSSRKIPCFSRLKTR